MNTYFINGISNLRNQLIPATSSTRISSTHYDIVKDFTRKSLLNINKSIIEGQYILIDVESDIDTIINDLSQIEFDYPNYTDLKKYLDAIRNGLNRYLSFYSRIMNIYGLKILNYNNSSRSFKNINHTELKLLDLNIRVNIIDNDFTSNNQVIIKLFSIKNELSLLRVEPIFTDIHTALITKIEFLSYKWYLRTAQKEHNSQYIQVLRNTRAQIPSNLFDNWIEKALNHYEIIGQNWVSYYDNEYNKIHSKQNNQLSFLEIHNKTKFLKDITKDEKELKKLYIDIKNKFNTYSSTSELENKSYDLIINYLANNYYSLICEKSYNSFELLKNKKNSDILDKTKIIIDDILNKYYDLEKEIKSNVNNFFLSYKSALYSTKILNELYDVCIDKHNFIGIFHEDITSNISSIINSYKSSKDWSLLNNNYIFKLDYSTSIIYHNQLYVYYASSFTLAKVDHDIENKFKEVEESYRDLKLRNTLKHEIESIYNLNQEFKKDNKRLIEIVGAFTAIISFIVGSIGAFEFIKTFYQAILFICIFAISISCFVFIIFASTRGIDIFKKNWHSLVPFIILISILGLLTYFNPNELKFPITEIKNIENKNRTVIDSIQKINDENFKKLEDRILLKNKDSK